MLLYFLLLAYNKVLSFWFSTYKDMKPVSWHRSLFYHYMILTPLDVSMLGDEDIIKSHLEQKLPYFKMGSTHMAIFVKEFMEFLGGKRRELFSKIYQTSTKLTPHEIEQRVSTIELIMRDYKGSDKLEQLTGFFILDHALPDETVSDFRRSILNCYTHSLKVWKNQNPASLSLS